MTITTTLIMEGGHTTTLSSVETPDVAATTLGTLKTTLAQSNPQSQTLTLINTGLIGPRGEPGPQGPEYLGDDLPDFTLIFDNKLI